MVNVAWWLAVEQAGRSSSEDKNSPVQQLELLEQVGVAALIFNWSVVKVDVKSQGPGISQVTLAWRAAGSWFSFNQAAAATATT